MTLLLLNTIAEKNIPIIVKIVTDHLIYEEIGV